MQIRTKLAASGLALAALAALAAMPALAAGTAAPAGAATPSTTASTAWAVRYVGGAAKAANAKASPVVVGVTNPIGLTGFPASAATVKAAQDYVNQKLGGVDGHPVSFQSCNVTDAQDAQSCGEQFANDPKMAFVVNGDVEVDDSAMLSALAAAGKPVILSLALTAGDLSATNAFNYGPGLVSVPAAIAQYAAQQLSGTNGQVSLITPNDPGSEAFASLLKSSLTAAKVSNVVDVAAPVSATAPEITSTIQAAGVSRAKVFIGTGNDTFCVTTDDALRSLGITPKVFLTTNGCFDQTVLQHYGGTLPQNWRIFDFGTTPYIPGLSTGVDSYLAAMRQYAAGTDPYTPTYLTFGALLTAVKLANAVGDAKLTPATMTRAAKSFTGPAMLEPGPMKCGYNKQAPSVCGDQVPVESYNGKKYLETIVTVGTR